MKKPIYRNQRQFQTEQQREADRRDERIADFIVWVIIILSIISFII